MNQDRAGFLVKVNASVEGEREKIHIFAVKWGE
jgi:hypothetical protein